MTPTSRRPRIRLSHYNLYTDLDPYTCTWTENLIRAGLIPPGDVLCCDIKEIDPATLSRYTQCHFFNGIGGWPYALSLAGWPPSRPCWTGSCPCPSFSVAGKGQGFSDPRHLWPVWQDLIRVCRPPVVFGEQAPGAIGHGWLDLVHADLEAAGYSVGAAVLGAGSVGAPHRRQRLYFAADLMDYGSGRSGAVVGLGYPISPRLAQRDGVGRDHGPELQTVERAGGTTDLVADPTSRNPPNPDLQQGGEHGLQQEDSGVDSLDPTPNSSHCFWSDADWILCTDGLFRAVEPGSFPLATGVPNRVGKLRAYGNSIVPQVAAEFIRAFMEAETTY